MPRKIVLSFLGNSPYKQCQYASGGFKSTLVRFFQEAFIQMLAKEWTIKDQVYIFLTPEAEKNNWEGTFYGGVGLQATLAHYPNITVQAVKDIPKGNSEAEIWQLFEILYDCLQEEDEVYLDITHGFRSLPMLQTVLLDYAKALKNIHVKKICYGAFETLGSPADIEIQYPNPADRIAPIVDLTSFSVLQDWTTAAADFKKYGNIQGLSQLRNNSAPVLNSVKTATQNIDQQLAELHQHIQHLIPLFQTNRGQALQQFPFDRLNQLLQTIPQEKNILKPLKPILQELQKKTQLFKSNDDLTWLKSAKWCQEHGLIQQAITQVREGFITWLCLKFQKEMDADFFDPTKSTPRILISNTFTIYHKELQKTKWQKKNKDHTPITRALLQDPIIQESAALFIELGLLRHDINHGGYQHQAAPSLFYERLNENMDALGKILEAS